MPFHLFHMLIIRVALIKQHFNFLYLKWTATFFIIFLASLYVLKLRVMALWDVIFRSVIFGQFRFGNTWPLKTVLGNSLTFQSFGQLFEHDQLGFLKLYKFIIFLLLFWPIEQFDFPFATLYDSPFLNWFLQLFV